MGGIQATIQVIDLPANIACQIEPEDEFGVQYATLTAPDGTEMCFDYLAWPAHRRCQ